MQRKDQDNAGDIIEKHLSKHNGTEGLDALIRVSFSLYPCAVARVSAEVQHPLAVSASYLLFFDA